MSVEAPIQGLLQYANPRYLGNWGTQFFSATSTSAGVANRVWLTPVWVPKICTVDQLSFEVATNGGAGTNLRLGLYADNGFTPAGGAVLGQSANIAADSGSNTVRIWAISPTIILKQGIVWAALETADTTVTFRRLANNPIFTDSAAEMMRGCRYALGGFGDLTDPCPAVTNDGTANVVCALRVSSW